MFRKIGREVVTLLDGVKPAGEYRVLWDGLDGKGQTMSSGIYYYKLSNKGFVKTKKMIMVK